jgi:Ca-activated chloride channel homolog
MSSLLHPWVLALMVLLPVVAWQVLRRERRIERGFAGVRLLDGVGKTWRTRLRGMPLLLRLVALGALIIAAARPGDTLGWTSVSTEGVAMQIVFDRSGSMRQPIALDDGRQTTRMEVARRVVRDFAAGDGKTLRGRTGDMIGLIAFARYADTLAPLSRSPQLIASLAEKIEPAAIQQEDGTAIGDAVSLAAARLKRAEEELARSAAQNEGKAAADFVIRSKVIILMTDGENNAGERTPQEAAELAKKWGIRVYTIAIAGQPIPQGDFPFALPPRGLDDQLLRDMATITDGRFFRADDASSLIEAYRAIDDLERTKIDSREHSRRTEKFAMFAAIAAAALILEVSLSGTILRRAG